jgi:hypothetical protein
MKKIILLLAMGAAITTQTLFAQVPSYVPTTGLVGYWPFNGNANDESGNGNNGNVNGATLSNDRFGINGKAYNFNGINSKITVPSNPQFINNDLTISVWLNLNSVDDTGRQYLVFGSNSNAIWSCTYRPSFYGFVKNQGCGTLNQVESTSQTTINQWVHLCYVINSTSVKIYKNGSLVSTNASIPLSNSCSNFALNMGFDIFTNPEYLNGKLDDIGIWNRALTQQEITNLYNSVDSNECLTLVINTGVLSTNPITYTSTVNIYPNPANDQITIDCGNLANVVGWNIKITNMLGQEVFNQPMNTQQYVVPLNSWTGQGMYFVKIINAQNEVVNIKKIILQ